MLTYSTYLGGNGFDHGNAIAVDAAGNIYVAGGTGSPDFTTANALQTDLGGAFDCYIAKLNPSGSQLLYSTYLGGSGGDSCFGMTVDSASNVYLTGLTGSPNFPLVGALQQNYGGGQSDAFIAKLNANGSALVYSTYLGGSAIDQGDGLVVDAGGAAYVVGETISTNFPTKNALQPNYGGGSQDTFVAKVQADGATLAFSTYLGGNNTDAGAGIAIDGAGAVYISGATLSPNFPVANALQPNPGGALDIFISKLNPSGDALVYSTYLGGSGADVQGTPGNPLVVDAAGNAYLTGFTTSGAANTTNFPLVNPAQSNYGGAGDAFVAKLNANGSALVYSTYLGGSGIENLDGAFRQDIAVDAAGQAYVTGMTASTNFPIANAAQSSLGGGFDAFVTKLSASGSALIYSTYLGGANKDHGLCIAVDEIGNAYVSGLTVSTNFQTANALQSNFGGGDNDAFIIKLGADAVTVSAASFSGAAIAPKAIVAAFGPNLATATTVASSVPLPITLAGTTVKIRDSAGVERAAPLFFVSAGQVNYQIPEGTAAGAAAVTVTSGDGRVSSGVMQVVTTAPALFTTSASGSGAAAAVDAFTGAGAPFAATRADGEPNVISFFGSGLGADVTDADGNAAASAQATIGGRVATVLYAGRAPGFVGLNQLNLMLPAGIAAGTYEVVVTRNSTPSNKVTITIR